VPPTAALERDDIRGHGEGGTPGMRQDADSHATLELPKDLRLWH